MENCTVCKWGYVISQSLLWRFQIATEVGFTTGTFLSNVLLGFIEQIHKANHLTTGIEIVP